MSDAGRVWYSGEDSDLAYELRRRILLSFLNYRNTLSAYVAHSKKGSIFHVGGGFAF